MISYRLPACLLPALPSGLIRLLLLLALTVPVATVQAHEFDVTVLGAAGGLEDGNLSAYLVREAGTSSGVLLDAGTVLNGIEKADAAHAFDGIDLGPDASASRSGMILHRMIKGYLLSHAHLDHVAGLVAISPEDPGKPVYALPSVLSVLQDDLFNHRVWPNLGDRGVKPAFGLLHYHDLTPGQTVPLSGTPLSVTAYPLSHGGVESTAFLLHSGQDALLYLGDTGPDAIEPGGHLAALWHEVAPLIRAGHLRGIIIECSYDNRRTDKQLFGHLTPRWLLSELATLQALAGVPMTGFPVLVSHIKPLLEAGPTAQTRIRNDLDQGNQLGVHFILASQGMTQRF
ncbi:MBL fold metallo-hydrolase [Asaia bogorensis]|uniref:MBL fold metallo-hydrolase n=1 Tax=Asaia bogorensis TaxID=91915 RepID=UPI000EFA8001|nr:3',5'-cyclic-nucleotide phosphodiesterase [Asaia bogorensis]NIE80053.1 3',5'-cyclic-nucleotide phosphodiesterase [Asaia sp. As-1742]